MICFLERWQSSLFFDVLLQTKAAFTRQYNKECHLTPYATGAAPRRKRGRGGVTPGAEEELEEGEGEEGALAPGSDSEEDDEGLGRDTMIKVTGGCSLLGVAYAHRST